MPAEYTCARAEFQPAATSLSASRPQSGQIVAISRLRSHVMIFCSVFLLFFIVK